MASKPSTISTAVPVCGEVAVSEAFGAHANGAYRLLEVDEQLLKYITEGGCFYLKGHEEDSLVLTTEDATFAVCSVESSNTVYLAHPPTTTVVDGDASATGAATPALLVEGRVGGHLQLTRIAPLLARLSDMLGAHLYCGEEEDEEGEAAAEGSDESAAGDAAAGTAGDADAAAAAAAAEDGDEGQLPSTRRRMATDGAAEREAGDASHSLSGSNGGSRGRAGASSSSSSAAADPYAYTEVMGMSEAAGLLGDAQYGHTQSMAPAEGFQESEVPLSFAQQDTGINDREGPDAPTQQQYDMDLDTGAPGGAAGSKGRAGAGGSGGGGGSGASEGAPRKPKRGYTRSELLARVQCSPRELDDGLLALQGALSFGPSKRYRLLAEDLIVEVLLAGLTEADAQGLGADALDLSAVAEALEHRFPAAVTAHVLRMHSLAASAAVAGAGGGSSSGSSGARSGGGIVTMSFARVAVTLGLCLLRPPSSPYQSWSAGTKGQARQQRAGGRCLPAAAVGEGWVPASEFLLRWGVLVPRFMRLPEGSGAPGAPDPAPAHQGRVSLPLLRGGVLEEEGPQGGLPVAVRYFSSEELAHEPAARFRQLFTARQRWTLEALEPFLQPLVGPGRSQAELLLKFTRSTLGADGKSRMFSPR